MPDYKSILSSNDIIGVIVVLIFFTILLYWTIPYFIKFKEKQQLFYIGLGVKAIGIIASFLFYNYIQKEVDTQHFFSHGKSISNILSEFPLKESIKVFYTDFDDLPLQMKSYFNPYFDTDVFSYSPVIIRIAGFFLFLTFNSYIACSIIFSFFGYIGCWLIFNVFSKIYPKLTNYFFCFIILYPPVFFWTSGIVKEPICMGCVGVLFFLFFEWKNNKKLIPVFIIAIILAALLLYNIKSYLFFTFFIALLISSIFYLIKNIKYKKYRYFSFASLCVLSIISMTYLLSKLENFLLTENAISVISKIDATTTFQLYAGGTNYDLGKIELSPFGLTKYLFSSINVALFRPYFFEITKLQLFLSGIDSILMSIFLIWLIVKRNFLITLRTIINSPLLIFSLIFVIILAAQIGAVSFNYGTLIRYKTPLTPFYFAFIGILLFKQNSSKKIR